MKQSTLQAINETCNSMIAVASAVRADTNEVASGNDHIAVIRHFDALRIAMEKIKEAREALQEMTDQLSRETVPEFMKRAGVKTLTLEGVGRVTVSHRYSCSMLDKDLGFKWLRTNDAGELIQETVNAQTLAAYAKNRLEQEGFAMPDDIFKVGAVTFTSITKK